MSKRQWLCVMGVWVMFALFLGFPIAWHKIILLISGLIIIIIARYAKRKLGSSGKKDN